MLEVTVLVLLARLAACVHDEALHQKYLEMPEDEFIEYYNSQDYSWKIKKYDENMPRYLGANFNDDSFNDFPVQTHDSSLFKDLPKNFDAREKWPNCKTIKEVNNQGQCGSCWTFGTANTASDRTCIHKDLNVHLSEEDFECMQTDVCSGGIPFEAFNFWKEEGLVSEECKPYNIQKLLRNKCSHKCDDKKTNYPHDKHYAEKIYKISNESGEVIKAELFHFGPIQAGYLVFEDFLTYGGGIYEHKFGKPMGHHSVRVIGYGVEETTNKEFWLVVNSWGPKWGEKGLFRVKTFDEGISFEDYLISGIPKK